MNMRAAVSEHVCRSIRTCVPQYPNMCAALSEIIHCTVNTSISLPEDYMLMRVIPELIENMIKFFHEILHS